MKFFHPKIITSLSKHRQACKDYWAYYLSIRDRLPGGCRKLQEGWMIHDAMLERIEFDTEKPDVTMVLLGDDFGDYFDGSLHFKGVFRLEVKCRTMEDDSFCRPGMIWTGISHIEIELLGRGAYEIRFLMLRGAEVTIGFRDMVNRLRIHRTKLNLAERRRFMAQMRKEAPGTSVII